MQRSGIKIPTLLSKNLDSNFAVKFFFKKKHALTGLILLISVFVFSLLIAMIKKEQGDGNSIDRNSTYWENKIKKYGAEKTYLEFKEYYASKEFLEQHTAAHIMGEVLYRTRGLGGFSMCDSSFAFGCYHSFLGQAIAERGISIVSELAQKCKDRYGENSTGCEHGIGHGIAEYLGPRKIKEALFACVKTNQRNPLFGCTSGLFMEYNSAIIFEKNTPTVRDRVPNKQNLLEPCDEVIPEEFRPSCYYEISLWWKNSAQVSSEKIGNLCGKAARETERQACYQGWGAVVAEAANYDHKKIITICALGATKKGWIDCGIGAIMRLVAVNKKNEARILCSQDPLLTKEFSCANNTI